MRTSRHTRNHRRDVSTAQALRWLDRLNAYFASAMHTAWLERARDDRHCEVLRGVGRPLGESEAVS